MYKPIPTPCSLVVKCGSNILGQDFGRNAAAVVGHGMHAIIAILADLDDDLCLR